MAFHSSSMLDAIFSTTHGAAEQGTITETGVDPYTAPCILSFDVELISEESNITFNGNIVEVRKADVSNGNSLAVGTTIAIGSETYTVERLIEQTHYTLKYQVSD